MVLVALVQVVERCQPQREPELQRLSVLVGQDGRRLRKEQRSVSDSEGKQTQGHPPALGSSRFALQRLSPKHFDTSQ